MVCSRNFCDYDSYYTDQSGGALDISYYRGAPYQRGYGVVSTFARRYGVPVLKYLFKQGVLAGKDILTDIVQGRRFSSASKSALRKRTASTLKVISEKLSDQSGGRI